jgi:hypothetical protein
MKKFTKGLSLTSYTFLMVILISCGRNGLSENEAKEELQKALTDRKEPNLIDSNKVLIKGKENAIALAEVVLFEIYGKDKIEKQQPYKVYNIDKHWIISGTIPSYFNGGTFLFIMDSRDGRILKIMHGK